MSVSNVSHLRPITDEDGHDWVRVIISQIVDMAVESEVGMVSTKGTGDHDGACWVFVITAACIDGRWQAHACWFDEDGENHETAFEVVLNKEASS